MSDKRDPAIRVVAMPADANAYGDIFGGWLLSVMDSGAGLTAARRAKGRAVTVAIDAMVFHAPVKVGDEVSVYTEIEKREPVLQGAQPLRYAALYLSQKTRELDEVLNRTAPISLNLMMDSKMNPSDSDLLPAWM